MPDDGTRAGRVLRLSCCRLMRARRTVEPMTASDHADLWLPTAVAGDEYVGPYRIIRRAGSGGMGVVYLAADKDERPVAVKVLHENISDDVNARGRLRRELLTMRRVSDRYIADVLDADLDTERPYIVSEFVHGPQLDHYIGQIGPLGRDGLVTLGRGLASALHAIHSVDVVHRDLKPGNVLLEGHRPVVIDFGIAQLADESRLTHTGLFVGTPGYVAPETIRGEPATPATDWWAWAAVLAYAATGKAPAGTGQAEVVIDRIRRGELRLEGVDADLRPLLEDCLTQRAHDRPRYDEIMQRFDVYARGGSTGPARVRPMPPPEAIHAAVRTAPAAGAAERTATAVLPATNHQSPASAVAAGLQASQRPAAQPSTPKPPSATAQPATARSSAAVPRRLVSIPVMAFAALLVASAMSMPMASGMLLLGLLTTARTVDGFVAGRRWRQEVGMRPMRATLLQSLGTPWACLKAAVVSVGTLLIPGALAVATTYGAAELLPNYLPPAGYVGNLSVGLGAVVALLALWFGPGGTDTRRAVHRALRTVAPTRQSTLGLSAALLIAVAAIAVVVYRFPVLDWWPLPGPPTRGL